MLFEMVRENNSNSKKKNHQMHIYMKILQLIRPENIDEYTLETNLQIRKCYRLYFLNSTLFFMSHF